MKQIIAMHVREPYRVWLRFDDGVEGIVDLAGAVAPGGVFTAWQDAAVFNRAAIVRGGRALEWPGQIDFCADALYLEVSPGFSTELASSPAPATAARS